MHALPCHESLQPELPSKLLQIRLSIAGTWHKSLESIAPEVVSLVHRQVTDLPAMSSKQFLGQSIGHSHFNKHRIYHVERMMIVVMFPFRGLQIYPKRECRRPK